MMYVSDLRVCVFVYDICGSVRVLSLKVCMRVYVSM